MQRGSTHRLYISRLKRLEDTDERMYHSVVHSCILGQGLPIRSSLEGPFIVFVGDDASLPWAPQATARDSVPLHSLSYRL
jgi:hypothetical protein